jgi:glucose-1-phosphate thymidylyltransferase
LVELVQEAALRISGATVLLMQVEDPERYGVVAFDPRPARRPQSRRSRRAQVELGGHRLYFYDNECSTLPPA